MAIEPRVVQTLRLLLKVRYYKSIVFSIIGSRVESTSMDTVG